MLRDKKKCIWIFDLEVPYEIRYRNIQYPRLEFKAKGLYLILPMGYTKIRDLLEKHKKWIYRQVQFRNDALTASIKKKLDKARSEKEFHDLVATYIELFSQKMGCYPQKVKFRKMISRWGGCNNDKKTITLNTYLKYLPSHIIKYVIFHELTHFIKRKHDTEFWGIIAQEFPDHKTLRKELMKYWYIIQQEQSDGTL